MNKTLEFMAKIHPGLSKDYKTPDGEYELCGNVAFDIATILIEEGKSPHLIRISGKKIDRINTTPIVPRIQKEIEWGGHVVCCDEDNVYDPMVSPKPILLEDYCKRAFKGEVEMKVLIPTEKMKEVIAGYNQGQ